MIPMEPTGTIMNLMMLFIISRFQVILMLKSVGVFVTDTSFKISLQIISHVLAYTSSCINPLLYAFLSENFRKAFRKVSGLIEISRAFGK